MLFVYCILAYFVPLVISLYIDIKIYKKNTHYRNPTIEDYCNYSPIIWIAFIPAINILLMISELIVFIWDKIKDIKI